MSDLDPNPDALRSRQNTVTKNHLSAVTELTNEKSFSISQGNSTPSSNGSSEEKDQISKMINIPPKKIKI